MSVTVTGRATRDPRISEERLTYLWNLRRAARDQPIPFVDYLEREAEKGLRLTWRELRYLLGNDRKSPSCAWPDLAASLVKSLTQKLGVSSVVDGHAGYGSLLGDLADDMPELILTGVERNLRQRQFAKELIGSSSYRIYEGFEELTLEKPAELLILRPPLGVREGGNAADGTSQWEQHLAEDAHIAVVLPTGFFRSPEGNPEFQTPPGFHIDACFCLPTNAWPDAHFESQLVVFSKKPREKMFLAYIENEENAAAAVENWIKLQEGQLAELGTYVEPSTFRGWRLFASDRSYEAALARIGLPTVTFSECVEICHGSKQPKEPTDEYDLVVPPNYRSDVASLAAYAGKRNSPTTLFLRSRSESPIDIDYLRAFLNSPLGRHARERASAGAGMMRTNMKLLLDVQVPVPERKAQQATMQALRQLQAMSASMEESHKALWSKPNEAPKVLRRLERFEALEGVAGWIETLPYPVASVLYRASADTTVHSRVDHLFHAFEAFAQLQATILLSIAKRDTELWQEIREKCLRRTDGRTWQRAAFGSWLYLGRCVSKKFSSLLESEKNEDRARLRTMLGSQDADFIRKLCANSSFRVLEDALDQRNRHKGHGGAKGEQQLKKLADLLDTQVATLSSSIGSAFDCWLFLRAGRMSYDGQIFSNQSDVLVGSHATFRQQEVRSLMPMEEGQIYLLERDSASPIKLVPLIRLMPAPQSEATACYFYNRLDGDSVRWVSYHFESEAEVRTAANETAEVVEFISLLDGEGTEN